MQIIIGSFAFFFENGLEDFLKYNLLYIISLVVIEFRVLLDCEYSVYEK